MRLLMFRLPLIPLVLAILNACGSANGLSADAYFCEEAADGVCNGPGVMTIIVLDTESYTMLPDICVSIERGADFLGHCFTEFIDVDHDIECSIHGLPLDTELGVRISVDRYKRLMSIPRDKPQYSYTTTILDYAD